MSTKTALFPGSFAPFTKGHYSIVERALPLFDKIIIAVGSNSEKTEYFSLQERMNWIKQVFKDEGKISVERYEGLTVDFCQQQAAQYILRGLRDSHDFKYEKGIAQMNKAMKAGIDTLFIITDPELSHISSSLVRDIVKNGGDVSQFIPEGMEI